MHSFTLTMLPEYLTHLFHLSSAMAPSILQWQFICSLFGQGICSRFYGCVGIKGNKGLLNNAVYLVCQFHAYPGLLMDGWPVKGIGWHGDRHRGPGSGMQQAAWLSPDARLPFILPEEKFIGAIGVTPKTLHPGILHRSIIRRLL